MRKKERCVEEVNMKLENAENMLSLYKIYGLIQEI